MTTHDPIGALMASEGLTFPEAVERLAGAEGVRERLFTVPLPVIADARLPSNYVAARTAIQQCVKIDECKEWADRAAALASYAKQVEDELLLKDSQRIKARAISRVSELLREIEAAPGARTDLEPSRGAPTRFTRKAAAEEAGLSREQVVTAMRVGNVPKEDFERQVESDNPPTITELARQGTKQQQKWKEEILHGADPEDFKVATALAGHLKFAADEIAEAFKLDLERAKRGMDARECAFCLKQIDTISPRLEALRVALEGGHATR
jgi:hypothetical protein